MSGVGVRAGVAVVGVVLLGIVGCSDDKDGQELRGSRSADSAETTTEPAATEVRSDTVTITDATVGDLTFDVLTAGDAGAAADGKLVLLLHGFPETSESYREILPVLAEAGYFAVAPDQRGYSPGARPTDVAAYGIVNMVEDAVAIAESYGAETFDVVGHDWGGAVAWVAAVIHADQVRTLTALSTPHPDAINVAFADPNNDQAQVSSYMAIFREPGSEERFLAGGAEAFFTGIGIPAEKAAAYAEVLGTPEALGAGLDWYRANPLPIEARIGPVSQPTLYIWGDEDIAFTRTTAEATAPLVAGPYTFIEMPGRGHWLPEEAPDEIAGAIVEHLDES